MPDRDPQGSGRRPMRATRLLVLVACVLLAPVPWVHLVHDDPPGNAWKLDGRLVLEDRVVDPPGRWSWLTVGRPPMVAEVLADRFSGAGRSRDMRASAQAQRPRVNEPAAAAVGLAAAGEDVTFDLHVELLGARQPGLPDPAVIVRLNGVDLVDRAAYHRALREEGPRRSFWTADGRLHRFEGPLLPYERVHVIEVAPEVQAAIGGRYASVLPVGWFRDLALGRSHGLMVALMTYADESGHDLARGRHIAGTGAIRGDGTVTRIGGLPAKARAARNRGADVLLFPAAQAEELEGFRHGRMVLMPVTDLTDAIRQLDPGRPSVLE